MVRKYSTKGGKTFRRMSLKKGGTKRKLQKGGMWRTKQCSALVGSPWNATNGGNHFSLGTPIGVGGSNPFLGNISPSPQTTFSAAKSLSQRGGKYKKRSRKGGQAPNKTTKTRRRTRSRRAKKSRRRNKKMSGGAVTGQSSKDSSHSSAPANNENNNDCVAVNAEINPPNPDTLLPQPLVNAYRVAKNSIFNAYNSYQGLPIQTSPLPHVQNSMQL